MAEERQVLHSGGCQCGAVRYALYVEPYGTHVCHCRMCQKAFGAFYAPLTLIRYKDFAWTRGKPSIFQSSPDVDRGFCSACGTPLTFAHKGSDYLDISVGSLDQPEKVKPEIQIGIESRIPWMAEIHQLKEQQTDQVLSAGRLARVESYQHPDHDTDSWPAKMSDIKDQTYCYMWEFFVKDGSNADFEKLYRADGAWAELFRRGSGYLRTDLIRDQSNSQRYFTIDHWRCREDYSEFRRVLGAAFEELDQHCEDWTVQESKIGEFTQID